MDSLYQEQILALAKRARDPAGLDSPTHEATVSNPTCGDRVHLTIRVDSDRITAASAAVRGCALCEAGAGLFVEMAPGMKISDVATLRDGLANWLAGNEANTPHPQMQAFEPVQPIRSRHKCVTLAMEAATKALG
jgi:nitrogen fixation NifU-like protein